VIGSGAAKAKSRQGSSPCVVCSGLTQSASIEIAQQLSPLLCLVASSLKTKVLLFCSAQQPFRSRLLHDDIAKERTAIVKSPLRSYLEASMAPKPAKEKQSCSTMTVSCKTVAPGGLDLGRRSSTWSSNPRIGLPILHMVFQSKQSHGLPILLMVFQSKQSCSTMTASCKTVAPAGLDLGRPCAAVGMLPTLHLRCGGLVKKKIRFKRQQMPSC